MFPELLTILQATASRMTEKDFRKNILSTKVMLVNLLEIFPPAL